MTMQKNNADANVIAVAVVRFGADPVAVKLSDDRTVRKALELSGIAAAASAEYFVDGIRADMEDVLEDGDVLSIVTPKQAGTN